MKSTYSSTKWLSWKHSSSTGSVVRITCCKPIGNTILYTGTRPLTGLRKYKPRSPFYSTHGQQSFYFIHTTLVNLEGRGHPMAARTLLTLPMEGAQLWCTFWAQKLQENKTNNSLNALSSLQLQEKINFKTNYRYGSPTSKDLTGLFKST